MNTTSRLLSAACSVALATSAAAQTVLPTNSTANNGGSSGWGIFFDITAECNDLVVSELRTASGAAAAATFDVEVFVRDGSGLGGPVGVGPGSDPAGWTSLGSATATQGPAANGISESIDIPDIAVPGGSTVGVALVFTGAGPRYFGTSTAPLQTFTDGVATVTAGNARTAPFTTTGSFFSSRALAGEITYTATEVAIVDNLPGTFIDISATGAPLGLGDDTEADITTTVGNSLLAAGTARVGANGGIRFAGTGLDLGWTNGAIPTVTPSTSTGCFDGDQTLLPFWDDISPNLGGEVFWQEIGGTLIVQWNQTGFFNTTDTATFQVQVFSSGPVVAQYLYQDIQQATPAGGASATIGYQAGGIGNDVTYSQDMPTLVDGSVLSVIHCVRPVGINYCTAVANSTGVPAKISATGSQSVAAMDLTFTASDIPMNSFGYFSMGTAEANVPMAGGGTGTLCIGGVVERGVGGAILFSGAANSVSIVADVNMLTPSSAAVLPGETRYFQYWFRDIGSTSNLSDGYRIRFE
ncbi:MAG: hypothetical protein R3F49_13645 [Planctomycetota bacterium]